MSMAKHTSKRTKILSIHFSVHLRLTGTRASRPARGAAGTRFVAQKEEEDMQTENDLDIYGEEDTKVG
jgi:hypothetical protein